jgi:hypothetical protein
MADINVRDARKIYDGLTADMEAAIIGTGNPGALKAWRTANQYFHSRATILEDILQPLLDKKTPEIAYNALLSGSKDGATVLHNTLKGLRPVERRLVTSAVLRRLGQAKPGGQDAMGEVFDVETYLTSWNTLAKEAKAVLFGPRIDPSGQLRKDLDRLAEMMSLQRRAARAMPNPAGTVQTTGFYALFNGIGRAAGVATGGALGHVLGGTTGIAVGMIAGPPVAAIAAQQLAQRVFTNPRMIHWMVRQTKTPFGALGQEIALLAKQSQEWDPESREIAEEMVQEYSQMDWPQIQLATAVADATARRQGLVQ